MSGSLLADWQIRERCQGDTPMLTPFVEEMTGPGIISYGLSSYGYDIRVGSVFRVCVGNYYAHGRVMDPKAADPLAFRDVEGDCIIPPNSFALAESVETFDIPCDILAVCLGKSTYARCGIIVNVTPLEPEWRGKLTIEISNTTPIPAKIYAGEGVAQLLFFCGDAVCEKSYADKGGKYQNQAGLTLARMPERK